MKRKSCKRQLAKLLSTARVRWDHDSNPGFQLLQQAKAASDNLQSFHPLHGLGGITSVIPIARHQFQLIQNEKSASDSLQGFYPLHGLGGITGVIPLFGARVMSKKKISS